MRNYTNTELKRRHDDKYAAIDDALDFATANIDQKRRNEAEKSLVSWVKTYCVGIMLDDPPPKHGCEVLQEMEEAVSGHSNYCILMARGSGKSSYVECATLYALATGIQKFAVIVSNNARSAANMLADIWRMIQESGTPFAQDYPEVCLPFQNTNGAFRRRQLYKGKSTELQKNSQQIAFARLTDDDGKELPTSGSVLAVRGITSGIRGMKKGTMRPTLVILDDLQDAETAENPESVEKLLNLIKKDIMALGGKERLAILQTATPIFPEDLVDHIKADPSWKTTTWPAIIKYPKDMALWERYFKMFDAESVADITHEESLEFYKKHQKQMDDGAELFNPTRFSAKDGHLTALQKMLEMKHIVGDAAFAAEYQMKPKQFSFSLDISPQVVVKKVGQHSQFEVPDGFTFIAASTDLNVSYAASTVLVAFKPDMTAAVLGHILTKCKIDMKLTDAEYNQKVYSLLTQIGTQLKGLGLHIDGWGIDANGKPFDTVTSFCKFSNQLCGIPACAMIGKASHKFNGYVRTRLKDELNRTVLCGDAMEHVKANAGKKYMFWDSDVYREMVQKAFVSELGSAGSCCLYQGGRDEHADYALQICNERLQTVRHGQDGRNTYFWKSKEPHDFLDSTAQAYAVAASQGMSSGNFTKPKKVSEAARALLMPRRRPKVVVV